MKFAFVILNYNVTDETIKCIESIKKIDCTGGIKYIIVVDNASDNQDVFFDTLKRKYGGDDSIVCLRSRKNTGYARGNNMGIHYAENVLKADFVCVVNPDVTIEQNDFIEKCISLYNKYDYAVLGPRLLWSGYRNELSCYIHNFFGDLRTYLAKKFNLKRFNIKKKMMNHKKQTEESVQSKPASRSEADKVFYDVKGKGTCILDETMCVSLVGCCLVFSPTFLENFGGLCRKTFLYGEEDLLACACHALGYRLLYSSEIKAMHEGGKSLKSVETDDEKRTQLRAKVGIRSDIAAIVVHARKNDKKYMEKILNPKIDVYIKEF